MRATRFLLPLLLAAQSALAQVFCVYDPLGTSGDYFTLFKDYQIEAKRWGVNLELQAYPDDRELIKRFESGQCDMASMVGLRARKYNKFTGTIDSAPGLFESYSDMRAVLNLLAQPKVAPYLEKGGYEVVGALPLGAGYAFVSDRNINSLQAAAGKRVVLPSFADNFDELIKQIHITPVFTDVADYTRAFSGGKAEIAIMPMVIYKPMELDKVLAKLNGGILRRPLLQFTMQILTRKNRFPPTFGQQSREFVLKQIDHSISIARNLDNQSDPRFWIYVKRTDMDRWDEITRSVDEEMAKQGILDPVMMKLMAKIRCRVNPALPDCKEGLTQPSTGSGG